MALAAISIVIYTMLALWWLDVQINKKRGGE